MDISTLWDTNSVNKVLWIGVSKNGDSTLNAETSTSILIPSATYKPSLAFSTNIALAPEDTLKPLLMSNIGGATCEELRINVTFNGQAGGAPFKQEYLPIFTEDNLGSFQLLTDSEEVVKDFSASVIGSKTKIENNLLYIAYETDDTAEILMQNQADIDAINGAIAALAEIVGGE